MIPGTLQVTGQIAPTAITDTYATHEDKYGKGGYMIVADIVERDAIPTSRRKEYMQVRTANDGALYELDPDLTTWNSPLLNLGGDMTKAVYDPNDDGQVLDSEHADEADHATLADTATFATTAGSAPPSGAASGDLTGTYPAPTVAALAITDAKVATANKDGLTGVASMRTLGTGSQQAAAGNDSRFTDSRPPSGAAGGDLSGTYPNPAVAALAITDAKVATANKDGIAGTPSMRTLGTGATQATAGNDSRLSDARTPSGSAGGELTGTYPNPTITAAAMLAHSGDINHNLLLNYVPAEHYLINDAGTGTTDLFSANKILSLISGATAGTTYKDDVQTASYANVASLSGLGTYNGYTLVDGDRIGLNAQTTGSENGIWVAHAGAWTRPADWTGAVVVTAGCTFFVSGATSSVVGDQLLVTTTGTITVDTTSVALIRIKRITLGTTGGTAAAGNDARIPTQLENDALQGTSGSPSNTNRYVTDQDTRLTNSRAPSGSAGGNLGGTYPNPTVVGLTIPSQVQGDIIYYNGSAWVRLAPGTAGYALVTNGAGANPAWVNVSGTGGPPTGAAGGSLGGTYPNPTVTAINIAGAQGNVLYYNGSAWVVLAPGTSGQVLTTNGGAANPSWNTPATTATPIGAAGGQLSGTYPNPSVIGLTIPSQAQGDIIYFNGTNWVRLAAGTNGQFLKTQGVAANPIWANQTTSGAAGGDLGGTYPNPTVTDLSITGEVRGNIIFFNGTNWVRLPNGTSGQLLQTNGVGADPTWVDAPSTGGGGSGFDITIVNTSTYTVLPTDSCILLTAQCVVQLLAASSWANETPLTFIDGTNDANANPHTITRAGSDAFKVGGTTHQILSDGGWLEIVSDEIDKWYIKSEF